MNDVVLIKLIDQLPQIITAVGALIAAILSGWALIQGKRNAAAVEVVRADVNDKMQQFIEVTKTSSRAEGILEEKGEQAKRDSDAPTMIPIDDTIKVAVVQLPEGEEEKAK